MTSSRQSVGPITETEVIALKNYHYAVLAAFEGGAEYSAIATTLNIPIGTVRSRLHRARAALAAIRAKIAERDGANA